MKLTYKHLLFLTVAIGFGLILALFVFSRSPFPEIEDYLLKNNFHGAALVAKDGKILLSKGFGLANREHRIPNKASTLFRLGSITKQFTAVAILRLQAQGKLDLHAAINSYLPDYPRGDIITVHQLLSHTSGIPSITKLSFLQDFQLHPASIDQVIDTFKNMPLEFAPGTSCNYSDSGYLVLGAIVEAVANMPYEEYLQREFFEPLGMRATYYDHNRSIIADRASGYEQVDDTTVCNARYIDMSVPHGAGALASTVEDLYIWNVALIEGRILSKESTDLLFTIHGSSNINKITYGYGFFVGPQNKGLEAAFSTIIGHSGTIEGFRAASYHYPDEDLTVILLSNVENTPINQLSIEIAKLYSSRWRS